jgi:hypothetical protein
MNGWVRKLSAALGEGNWLIPERARFARAALLAIPLVAAACWILLSRNGIDRAGKPLGTDFVSFWTASELALGGHAAGAYDIAEHWGAQKALFGDAVGYTAFFYPPPYLLICLPLSLAPYFVALMIWLTATGFAFAKVVRAFGGRQAEWLTILAFPAVLLNAGHGQNGFLSAALIGAGALWLDRRPILAGVCFGALIYKPQLAVMIPFALIAARRWTTIAAATASAAALTALSVARWGVDIWKRFLDDSSLARKVLEQNLVGDEKMQSVFSAVRLWHGGLGLAYGLQIVVSIGVVVALVWMQRRAFRNTAEGPAIVAAALLGSPFLLDYDLTLLAIPLAWLFRRGAETGFLPGEKLALALGFALPLYARLLAGAFGLPLTPILCLAVLGYVVARGIQAGREKPADIPRDAQPNMPTGLLLANEG